MISKSLVGKATHGDSLSQFQLAECYEFGKNTSPNIKKALYWYKKASKNQYYLAQCRLGTIFEYGKYGIEKNLELAFFYYKNSADNGYDFAQYKTAEMLEYGKGVKIDREQAFIYYKKSADSGYEPAQCRIKAL